MLRTQRGNPQLDAVIMDFSVAAQNNRDGLFAPLEPAKVPNLADIPSWDAGEQHGRCYHAGRAGDARCAEAGEEGAEELARSRRSRLRRTRRASDRRYPRHRAAGAALPYRRRRLQAERGCGHRHAEALCGQRADLRAAAGHLHRDPLGRDRHRHRLECARPVQPGPGRRRVRGRRAGRGHGATGQHHQPRRQCAGQGRSPDLHQLRARARGAEGVRRSAVYGPTNSKVTLEPKLAARIFGTAETRAKQMELDWEWYSRNNNALLQRIRREVIAG